MLKLLRGIDVDPVLVGVVRGVLEALVFLVAALALDWLGATDSPEWAKAAAPLAVLIWRSLEGYADRIDPGKQRRP